MAQPRPTASPHQNKTLAWPNAVPRQAQHTKSGSPHKKQISLDKLLEHTSECQSLDKIRAKPDKGIKPLPFLMSTVAFFMRATRTQSDILLLWAFWCSPPISDGSTHKILLATGKSAKSTLFDSFKNKKTLSNFDKFYQILKKRQDPPISLKRRAVRKPEGPQPNS